MLQDGILRLTNSEMALWRQDRRHWYLACYRRLRLKSQTVLVTTPTGGIEEKERVAVNTPLAIGTRVHDALAAYYVPEGEEVVDPVEWIRQSYDRDIAADPIGEADLVKEKDLSVTMVEGYMQWLEETGADAELRVLAPETKIEVPLIDGATLLSKIDARVIRESDGARLSLEHKTVQSLNEPLPLLQTDYQLRTEHLVEMLDLKNRGLDAEVERARGVLYNMLRKVKRTATAKPPFYGREEVDHNVHELRNHFHHCATLAAEIIDAHRRLDEGESHHIVCPPSPTRESTWKNPFFGMYPLMDDGSDYEAAFADLYETHNPLERYDGTTAFDPAAAS